MRVVIVLRAAKSRLPRFLTGSFTIHTLLLCAIVIIPATRHRATPIEDTMVVALAGPLGGATASSSPPAPAAKPHVAPAPAPPPPPKEAHTVHEVPPPKPKDKQVKPKTPPAKEPEPEAPPSPSPHGTGTGAAPTATPGTGTSPAPGTGAVTATVGGGDSALGWYGAAVKAALEAAWIKPYLEDAEGTASVVVSFDIGRDGTTRNLRVAQSSGIPSLDRSAQRAVIEASPLPGIPPTWTEPTLPVTMRSDLTPENR